MEKRPIREAPRETPVYLVFAKHGREWRSPVPFWKTDRGWRSAVTGLYCASTLAIVGWIPVEPEPAP